MFKEIKSRNEKQTESQKGKLKTFPTNWNKKRIVKKRYGMKRTSMVPYPSTKFPGKRKRKEFRKTELKQQFKKISWN